MEPKQKKLRIALVLLNGFIAKSRRKKLSFTGRKGAYAPTTLTPNAYHAYQLADILQKRKIVVVLGGYHV